MPIQVWPPTYFSQSNLPLPTPGVDATGEPRQPRQQPPQHGRGCQGRGRGHQGQEDRPPGEADEGAPGRGQDGF